MTDLFQNPKIKSTMSKTSKMPLELGSALSIDREPVNDPEIRTQALEAIYLISLQVRGSKSLYHPSVHVIRRMIETVLLWPCLNSDSVSKAQHGCIDCLALMICAELQAEEDFIPKRTSVVRKKGNSVVSYVINQFFNDKESTSTPELGDESIVAVPLSFRVCMGNVLISAFQKISESCKKQFAEVIPSVLHSVKFEKKSDIIAACIQVLFSAVYHLRSAVLPYASDLLKVSLKALRKKSDKLSFLFHKQELQWMKVMNSELNHEMECLKNENEQLIKQLENSKALNNLQQRNFIEEIQKGELKWET
ncbi:hypothetical protein RIF29_04523 [Crotalaria pallida]|uniref:Uncharacterized protein n=1 Tax=Crotalaria pallida TaxID=3830 RepID=A0AAN9J248_CROPI